MIIKVALPTEAVAEVERLAGESAKTKTQILREAIALKAFVERELGGSGTRLLIDRNGGIREIVFTVRRRAA